MAGQRKQLKAQFYITRENGDMVPLVALDELPDNMTIEGVPRTLSPGTVSEMICVGNFPTRQAKHSIANEVAATTASLVCGSPPPHSRGAEPSTKVGGPQGSLDDNDAGRALLGVEDHTTGGFWRQGREQKRNTRGSSGDTPSRPVPGLPSRQVKPGVKEYCSYWLRRGECDYAQQGCLYKHEMPMDLDTLNRLGFRDIPMWYRERHGVGSLLAASGPGVGFDRVDRSNTPSVQQPQPTSTNTTGRQGRERRPFRSNRVVQPKSNTNTPDISNNNRENAGPPTSRGPRRQNFRGRNARQPQQPRQPSPTVSTSGGGSDIELDLIREDEERKARYEARLANP